MSTPISDALLGAIGKAIAVAVESEMRLVRSEIAQARAELTAELASAKAQLAEDRLKLRDLLAEAPQRPAAKLFKAG